MISIALYNGDLFSRACFPLASCKTINRLPSVEPHAHLLKRLKAAGAALFAEHERTAITAIAASRFPIPVRSEAVLPIDHGIPDLSPLYSRFNLGAYQFVLQKVANDGVPVEDAEWETVFVADATYCDRE